MISMAESAQRAARILLVEDDEGDALLTEKAFRSAPLPTDIHHVWSGEEALDFLECKGRHTDADRPDLILLDLNLPEMTGREFLTYVKTHPTHRRIPVVVLTSSRSESDILSSYDSNANTYMVKPGDPNIFRSLALSFEDYWLRNAILASR